MRILWHAAAPWTPTGYGVQTAQFLPRLRDLGHEIVVSAVNQHLGSPLEWKGFQVHSAGQIPFGEDVLPGYVADIKPDLLITMGDAWNLPAKIIADLPCPAACWVMVDTDQLGFMDRIFYQISGATPLAPSRHAERLLTEAGLHPVYVPCGVDTDIFRPPEGDAVAKDAWTPREPLSPGRKAVREFFGIEDSTFAAGIVAMNKGVPSRKAFWSQMAGWAAFHEKHPDSVLFVHSQIQARDGEDLAAIAADLGILDVVNWTNQHKMVTGQVTQHDLAKLYTAMDVMLNASMGEGFGVPVIESLACGTPVIITRCSALTELVPPMCGWQVGGVPLWNPTHRARWVLPDPAQITKALEKALRHDTARQKRALCRIQAMEYDVSRIVAEHLGPALDKLAGDEQIPVFELEAAGAGS